MRGPEVRGREVDPGVHVCQFEEVFNKWQAGQCLRPAEWRYVERSLSAPFARVDTYLCAEHYRHATARLTPP